MNRLYRSRSDVIMDGEKCFGFDDENISGPARKQSRKLPNDVYFTEMQNLLENFLIALSSLFDSQ